MTTFGLITEGLTDQIVIENILSGYFNTNDLIVNPLQPERDKDNEDKLDTLNKALIKTKNNFTIDAKKPEYYRIVSDPYSKHKKLMKNYQNNPSLKIFIQEIETRKIVIEGKNCP